MRLMRQLNTLSPWTGRRVASLRFEEPAVAATEAALPDTPDTCGLSQSALDEPWIGRARSAVGGTRARVACPSHSPAKSTIGMAIGRDAARQRFRGLVWFMPCRLSCALVDADWPLPQCVETAVQPHMPASAKSHAFIGPRSPAALDAHGCSTPKRQPSSLGVSCSSDCSASQGGWLCEAQIPAISSGGRLEHNAPHLCVLLPPPPDTRLRRQQLHPSRIEWPASSYCIRTVLTAAELLVRAGCKHASYLLLCFCCISMVWKRNLF
ncbi:hypothetical protein BCR34DRAFT_117848 [Clohesyomyces aquaticus]|uniref:Uncharacterized protein n=1 Tax=Clohesyomyces aquaticus TaxID=1231657 RepID=A0A1Y1YPU3_9PLEO|nr:hypothetical protein BCR34DRAFT_117848 [Clohesyomyces aquaticus]